MINTFSPGPQARTNRLQSRPQAWKQCDLTELCQVYTRLVMSIAYMSAILLSKVKGVKVRTNQCVLKEEVGISCTRYHKVSNFKATKHCSIFLFVNSAHNFQMGLRDLKENGTQKVIFWHSFYVAYVISFVAMGASRPHFSKRFAETWEVAQKTLRWNVLFFFDAHAVLFCFSPFEWLPLWKVRLNRHALKSMNLT